MLKLLVRRRWNVRLAAAGGLAIAGLAALWLAPTVSSQDESPRQELVKNRSFEDWNGGVPREWIRDTKRTGRKGEVGQDSAAATGATSLVMHPNSQNGGSFPLAIAQVIPAAAFRGKKVHFSAQVRAEGGAKAVLGMLNFTRGRGSSLVTVHGSSATGSWEKIGQGYDVPDDGSVQLVITCIAEGGSGATWFDDVSVTVAAEDRPGSADSSPSATRRAPSEGPALTATVSVDAGQIVRQIPRELFGSNIEWIWNGNLAWQEKQQRLDPDLERLTREMGVSLLRYPGGLFSDFYHWRNGVGPQGLRPEMLHQAGKGDKSRALFGTDEALAFAERTGGELMITVNAGTGTPEEAAEWVRYVAGKKAKVRFWEVGNELYMNDGTPHQKAVVIEPGQYARRFLEFAARMRKADPSIKIGAIGGENEGKYANVTYPNWNRILLETAGSQIDFLAIHNAYAPIVMGSSDEKADVRTVYGAMLGAPQRIARNLARVSEQIQKYAPRDASRIRLAVTEWGPAFQFDFRSRYVSHGKTLGSALFVGSTLKAFIESPQTDIANFFLLNDLSVMGWIGSRSGRFPPEPDWTPTARYYALQMFTKHFGQQLVASRTEGPHFNTQTIGFSDAEKNVPVLDIVSSLSRDGQTLYVIGVNKDFDRPIDANISLRGFRPLPHGEVWTLNGRGIDAHSGTVMLGVPGLRLARQAEDSRFRQGGPGEIVMESSSLEGVGPGFKYRFPAHSITSLILKKGSGGAR